MCRMTTALATNRASSEPQLLLRARPEEHVPSDWAGLGDVRRDEVPVDLLGQHGGAGRPAPSRRRDADETADEAARGGPRRRR